jgi:hypothetical protein
LLGLLGRDSYNSNAESDKDKEERDFYQQRSGREVEMGENYGFCHTRRGQRVIPNGLGANSAYRDIGFPGKNMGAYQQCGQKPAQMMFYSQCLLL